MSLSPVHLLPERGYHQAPMYIYQNLAPMRNSNMADYVRDSALPLPGTNARKQQNDFSAMAENDLLEFKANWREFCDRSYFRDLTSNQRRLRK